MHWPGCCVPHILTTVTLILTNLPSTWGGCPEPCQCTGFGELSVDCSYKQLTGLPDGLQYNITSLNLSGNFITSIEAEFFEGFTSLTELYLSNNLISSLSISSFKGLTSLSRLYLNANNITHLPDNVFTPLVETLNYLDLSQNYLQELPPKLDECYYLEQLLLKANYFTSDIFEKLNTVISLKNLDLSDNPIKELPYLSFHNMVDLQYLTLEKADIGKIDNNAFAKASELRYLHMLGNNLKTVNREMLQPLYKLQELDISENSLICECSTKQLQDLVKENKIRLQNSALCLLQNGSQAYLDIDVDDLDFLCQGHGPTDPPPVSQCDNVTVDVYHDIMPDGDVVMLSWNYTVSLTPAEIVITYRLFGSEIVVQDILPGNSSSYNLTDLDGSSGYIACVIIQECNLKSCREFITPEELQTSICPIVLAVGLTVAAFLLIFLVLLLVKFALMWKKHGKDVLKNFKKGQLTKSYTPNGTIPRQQTIAHEPRSTQVPVPNQRVSTTARSEHPYEAIPADALNGFTNLGYLPSDNSEGGLDQQIPTAESDTVNNNTLTDEYLTPVPSTPSDTPHTSSRQCACSFVELHAHHQLSSSGPRVYHKYEEPKDVSVQPHSLPSSSPLSHDQPPPRRQHSLDRSFPRAQSEGFILSNHRVAYGTMPRGQGRKRPLPGCSCGNHFCRTLSRPLPATPVDLPSVFTPPILNHMKPVVSVESPVDTIEHREPHMRWQSSLHLSAMSECEV